MKYFEKLPLEFNIEPLLAQLEQYPQFWNQNKVRTASRLSPHREVDDIWIRYRRGGVPPTVTEPFNCIWYPEADYLSEIYQIVEELVDFSHASDLGGILITRIGSGKLVYPHHDRGAWHAEFHNYKVYVALKSNSGCNNRFGDSKIESFVMKPGEAWSFNNQVTHTCFNNGDSERISLIVSMRI